jgi:hypothetical protein
MRHNTKREKQHVLPNPKRSRQNVTSEGCGIIFSYLMSCLPDTLCWILGSLKIQVANTPLALLGKAHEAPLTGCQVPTSFQTGVASWWLFRNLWCNPTPMAPLSIALVGLSKVLHPWDTSLPGLQSFQSLLWNQGGGSNPLLTPLPMLCTVPWRKPYNIHTATV